MGQLKGAGVCILLGFVPALILGSILRMCGLLRVRSEVELLGMDAAEIPSQSYPEFSRRIEVAHHVNDSTRHTDNRQ